MGNLRHKIFWPPFLLMVIAMFYGFYDGDAFILAVSKTNSWIMDTFGWLMSITALAMLLILIFIFFSKLGSVKIGGRDAMPMLTGWRWFAITLCTSVGGGFLLWATCEPLYHIHNPPASLGLSAGSADSARFALSTMFLHWSFVPFAIYTLPAVTFALFYYNMGRPFSISSMLSPLFGDTIPSWVKTLADAVCLYALAVGMIASFGQGILTLEGGISHMLGFDINRVLSAVIVLMVLGVFILSSTKGLIKGLRILSGWNVFIFFLILAFLLIMGPTLFIFNFGCDAMAEYFGKFPEKILFTGIASGDPWPKNWSEFYWAFWMAWAPVTGMFLGRIGYGYSVRSFILMNFLVPAAFAIIWTSIVSGTIIHMEMIQKIGLNGILMEKGPESLAYVMFSKYPFESLLTVLFFCSTFITYVIAMDSSTNAMGGLCSKGISPESPEAGPGIKITWGVLIGCISWLIISYSPSGIQGIKMSIGLGGLPILFFLIAMTFAALKTAINPDMLDPIETERKEEENRCQQAEGENFLTGG
ncbi:MAG: BCCT family transporter [Oligoflexales bacterium]|nr:BCCT family transporter [Oligoflexales bacterium]